MSYGSDTRSWVDVKAPGTAGRRRTSDGRSISARILSYLAAHPPTSAAGVHFGAGLEAPTWKRGNTCRLLGCLAAHGKIRQLRGGLYGAVPAANGATAP